MSLQSSRGDAKQKELARIISRLGLCSRAQAQTWVREGRVTVDGVPIRNPEYWLPQTDLYRVRIDGKPMDACVPPPRYLMLNKPRGLLVTANDERNRETVYRCFENADLGWIAPVGRLDKASEGLLLFSNDPAWAARISEPDTGPSKTYHVQVNCLPNAEQLRRMADGVPSEGDRLAAESVRILRHGDKRAWLEIVLNEGRNRHIRRLLAALDIDVLRLVRVSLGSVRLGDLAKGYWRPLEDSEIRALVG